MSKVRILSPRPEISNRRKCGGFNFLFGTCGVSRQTAVCRGSNLSLDLSSKDDKSACILVFMRIAQGLFLYTRIPSAYACGYPRSCSNFALLVFTYSDSPRPEIRKVVVIHSAQISDITYTGKFRTVKDV